MVEDVPSTWSLDAYCTRGEVFFFHLVLLVVTVSAQSYDNLTHLHFMFMLVAWLVEIPTFQALMK